jgi:hypothetical protein
VVPRLDFVAVLWSTLGFVATTAGVFVASAGIRAAVMSDQRVIATGVSRLKIFKRRAISALVTLGTIVYLQVAFRVIEGLHCERTEADGHRLSVQLDEPCYADRHLAAYPVLLLLLVFYLIGFPLSAVFVLRRAAAKGLLDEKCHAKWGFLYRAVRPEYYYFRLLGFANSFALAVSGVLMGVLGQLTVAATFFVIHGVAVGLCWPYQKNLTNLAYLGSCFANTAQVLVFLYLEGHHASFGLFLTVACLALVSTVAMRSQSMGAAFTSLRGRLSEGNAATAHIELQSK